MSIVHALLEAEIEVTALIPPDDVFPLRGNPRLRIVEGDPWNRGSLTGRSRGHGVVIHAVGAMHQQPERGLTYHYLNAASLQNISRMAIGDGVRRLVFISAAWAPWMPRGYIESKRRAEQYLQRSGIPWTVVRAPLAYPRGRLHNPLLLALNIFGGIPLLGRPAARLAPLPVDVIARGAASIATDENTRGRIIFGRELRKRGRAAHRDALPDPLIPAQMPPTTPDDSDDSPFGWLP